MVASSCVTGRHIVSDLITEVWSPKNSARTLRAVTRRFGGVPYPQAVRLRFAKCEAVKIGRVSTLVEWTDLARVPLAFLHGSNGFAPQTRQ